VAALIVPPLLALMGALERSGWQAGFLLAGGMPLVTTAADGAAVAATPATSPKASRKSFGQPRWRRRIPPLFEARNPGSFWNGATYQLILSYPLIVAIGHGDGGLTCRTKAYCTYGKPESSVPSAHQFHHRAAAGWHLLDPILAHPPFPPAALSPAP